jgi:hypothetical protein
MCVASFPPLDLDLVTSSETTRVSSKVFFFHGVFPVALVLCKSPKLSVFDAH